MYIGQKDSFDKECCLNMAQFQLNALLLDEAINKTGFPTEYNVQKLLEKHGWSVISNRYYIDDQKKIEREIDLLASKNGVRLVISCKKSETDFWTFMTSQNNGVVVPVEYKTKDKIVRYFLNNEEDVFRTIISKYSGFASVMTLPEMVRAFQQMVISTYKSNNDKHIYDSIITTIKAAEYEENHSKENALYFMLSVFEGEMVKKDFDTGVSSVIDDIKYVNRHYIGTDDRYYCVRFIKLDVFDRILDEYDKVAEELPYIINDLHNEFKLDVFKKPRRWEHFWRKLEHKFFHEIHEHYGYTESNFSSLATNPTSEIRPYLAKSGKLHLAFKLYMFVEPSSYGQEINRDEFCRNLMAKLLKEFYGYEGKFVIENDQEAEKAYREMFGL